MISFYDFPLRKERSIIYSKDNKIIIDLENSSKEKIDEFFALILQSANYGKRFFIKRISKQYPVSLKDCIDIAIMEAYRMGYMICKKEEAIMEYVVTSTTEKKKEKTKKLYFKPDTLNRRNNE